MLADVAAPARTRVQLCGPLLAEIGGRRVDAQLPGRKGRLLFTCLVFSRDRPLSRDELIEVIWPADAPADPDGTLATLLTRLRNAVGRELLVGRGELRLDLGEHAWVDWDVAHTSLGEAERLIAAGNARRALTCASEGLEIARRPLLPELSTPWLEERRRELMDLASALLETQGRAALALRGEHLPLAERSARELIEREPYRESGYGLLMEVHESRGNAAEALRVYDTLRHLLREELGLTPAPALTALADRLLACEQSPTLPALNAPAPLPAALAALTEQPLAGRRDEFQQLAAAVMGGPRFVAVTGETGIGKSRLAAEVADHARGAGFTVLHGRSQREPLMGFEPFTEALRGFLEHGVAVAHELLPVHALELAELATLVPALRQAVAPGAAVSDAPHTQRTCDGITALLAAAANRRPVLLVLENLQWADRQTLLALRRVVAVADITVLATLRDDEPHAAALRTLLVDLRRERALATVALGPLDDDATAELLGAPGVTPEIRALRAHAGGNPFFLEELIGATGNALPPGLRDTVETRLEALPAELRDALAACAAAGPAFVPEHVATVVAPERLERAIAYAVRAGLLIADGRRCTFRHGLVRHALLAA